MSQPTPARRTALRVGASLLATALVAGLVPSGVIAFSANPATVWINEIHYDNTGTDSGEFVEVAGPAGTSLDGWSIVLYNGNGGVPYNTGPLSGTIPNHQNGFGVVTLNYLPNGIQNGAPDAIALVNGTTLVQFLSYEGAFTAATGEPGGVAAGVTSTDIGVAEAGSEPLGLSLQLTGTGTTYQDFTWNAPAAQSPGAVNAGQTLQVVVDAPVQISCGDALTAAAGYAASRSISATDADDRVVALAITSTPVAGISLDGVTAASTDGGTATATLTVAGATAPGTYPVEVTATNDDATPATASCTLTVTVLPVRSIGEVQGAVGATANGLTHRSSFAPATGNGAGQSVAVRGVVTQETLAKTSAGARNYGFFLQEPAGATDGNPNTSDGIFVFLGTSSTLIGGYAPVVGDEVVVTGRVSEFFSLTQLVSASLQSVVRSGVDVAAEVPPFEVQPPADLAEANRYWERREGMQAKLPAGSLVQGGRSVFGSTADAEVYYYRGDYAPLAARSDPYARRVFRDPHPLDDIPDPLWDNGNGFRFLTGSLGVKAVADDENVLVGPARTNDVLENEPVGGVYFSFSKYQIQVTTQPVHAAGADPSLNAPVQASDPESSWTSATYNVENLYDFRDDPFDGCDFAGNTGCVGVNPPFDYVPSSAGEYDAQLTLLAQQILGDLHAPDLILVQEAEDQDICTVAGDALACGTTNNRDGKPDTLQELALRIADLGGPTYEAASDRDGADDRGIVSGFLFRTDRVELLPVASTDPVLGASTGIAYPRSAPLAYNTDVSNPKTVNAVLPADLTPGSTRDGTNVFTRPPQVGHFRLWRDGVGTSVFVDLWAISNHFSSTPDGRVFQRIEQSVYNAAIVDAIEAADPDARIVVGGDFNVFPRPDDPYAPGQPVPGSTVVGPTDQLRPLYEQGLHSLWDELVEEVPAAAYSYVFQGQAQTLDAQFINPELAAEFQRYRVAHINADFAAEYEGDGPRGASDHDPSSARYALAVTVARLRALVDYLAAADAFRGPAEKAVLDRMARIERFVARGQDAAAADQAWALASQVLDLSPRFIDADVAAGLAEEAELLAADL